MTTPAISRDAITLLFQLWGLERHNNKKMVPLPTPSSLMRGDLTTLGRRSYLIGVKSDGIRAVLLCGFLSSSGERYAVYIKRNGHVTPAQITLPSDSRLYCGTALDGELLESGEFVVFDCVAHAGHCCVALGLAERLEYAQKAIVEIDSPFVKVKTFLSTSESKNLFVDFDKGTLGSDVDGIIIAPQYDPIGLGRLVNYFKLKARADTTVDLEFNPELKVLLCGPPGNELVEQAIRGVSWKESDFQKAGIYECNIFVLPESDYPDRPPIERIGLAPKTLRENDKDNANSAFVVSRTINNVIDPILGKEVLASLQREM